MNKELFDYVTSQLAEGVSPAELKKALLEVGWQEADVNAALLASQKPLTSSVTLRPTPNPFASSTQQTSTLPSTSSTPSTGSTGSPQAGSRPSQGFLTGQVGRQTGQATPSTQQPQIKTTAASSTASSSSASFQGEASYTTAQKKIKRKKLGLIVGVTGGALVLIGLGVFFFMHQPTTSAPVVVTPPPPPVEPPQPAAPPTTPPLGITLQPGATFAKGVVNRAEIGGKNLLVFSPVQGTSTVQDDGSFLTGVPGDSAQIFVVLDDTGKTRATTVALPQFADMLMFDVSSTAATAVFQTVGILTTNTKDAEDRLVKINTLTCFPKVATFLRARLATSSLTDLASDKGYATLLSQCGTEMTKGKL